MEKKILTIMVVLVVVAALMVAVVMIAAGGMKSAGGFTRLFDDLENPSASVTYNQYLEMPEGWELGKDIFVDDRIVDMYLMDTDEASATITIYQTALYFVYTGNTWADPDQGTSFYVPNVDAGAGDYLHISHGLFRLVVSSTTNISAEYDIGDTISLETTLVLNDGIISFDEWSLAA